MKKTQNGTRKWQMGLREKILFPVTGLFIVSIVAVLFLVLLFSSTNTQKLTVDLMDETNYRYANVIQSKLNSALDGARALKPIFEQTRISNRSADIELMKAILEQHKDDFGVYTAWEPNVYDGQDAKFAGTEGHDASGRFIPYVYREAGAIAVSPLTGYEEEGVGDYYLLPKNTLSECIIDPFLYPMDGKDVYVTSMVVPITKNGQFAGIVGMDVLVDTLIEGVKDVTLFKTGYMFMADSTGKIFYHPDSELIGQSLAEVVKEDGVLIEKALQTGEQVQFERKSLVSGEVNTFLVNPVSIGGRYWLVASSIPKSEVNAAVNSTILIGGMAGLAAVVLTAIVLLMLVSKIVKPVGPLTAAAKAIEEGSIDSSVRESLSGIKSTDEIGKLAQSMLKAVGAIERVAADTRRLSDAVSHHDMTVEADTQAHSGIYREIMTVVNEMFSQMSQIVQSIGVAVAQISTGASQVASGAQALAAGSSEQASSVEELSATVGLIAEQAAANSDHVDTATEYVDLAVAGMNEGNDKMRELATAMVNIDTASQEIAKITKLIEDIAFQTNILALNAAIEAARAGNAGKGFAVVADEVRNLAAKSAEAAKQTTELITASVAAVSEGTKISEQTGKLLLEVGEKARRVTQSMEGVKGSSAQQAVAIEQVRQGLVQISAVVQNNAATAEENSATSEEMSAQAAILQAEVGAYKLRSDIGGADDLRPVYFDSDLSSVQGMEYGKSGFGKY